MFVLFPCDYCAFLCQTCTPRWQFSLMINCSTPFYIANQVLSSLCPKYQYQLSKRDIQSSFNSCCSENPFITASLRLHCPNSSPKVGSSHPLTSSLQCAWPSRPQPFPSAMINQASLLSLVPIPIL